MNNNLTRDELIFLQRALPHFMAGKTVQQAMEAVLEDDNRIGNALFAPERDHGIGFNDEHYSIENHKVAGLRQSIAAEVYQRLRVA